MTVSSKPGPEGGKRSLVGKGSHGSPRAAAYESCAPWRLAHPARSTKAHRFSHARLLKCLGMNRDEYRFTAFGLRSGRVESRPDQNCQTNLEYLDTGLDDLARVIVELGITSIALPTPGGGNGGLDWRVVRELIVRKLEGLDAAVFLFAPSGARGADGKQSLNG